MILHHRCYARSSSIVVGHLRNSMVVGPAFHRLCCQWSRQPSHSLLDNLRGGVTRVSSHLASPFLRCWLKSARIKSSHHVFWGNAWESAGIGDLSWTNSRTAPNLVKSQHVTSVARWGGMHPTIFEIRSSLVKRVLYRRAERWGPLGRSNGTPLLSQDWPAPEMKRKTSNFKQNFACHLSKCFKIPSSWSILIYFNHFSYCDFFKIHGTYSRNRFWIRDLPCLTSCWGIW